MTDGKRWATDWLFRHTLQDLNDLLDLTLGEDGYERLKAARLAVVVEASRYKLMTQDEKEEQRRSFAYGNVALSNPAVTREGVDRTADEVQEQVLDWDYALEARPIPKGATHKMDVQLPGAGFERYDREPENEALTDEITASLLSRPPAVRRRGTLVVKPDTSPAIPPTTSESFIAPATELLGDCVIPEIPLPHWSKVFPEWLTPEDEEAYTNLQEDTPTMEEIGKALGYRTGQTKTLFECQTTEPAPTLYVTKIDQETKTVTLSGTRIMDFDGRWNTREGGIADVGAQNCDDWNEEGRHRHDTNLDLMERLRDGGNRIFEPTRKDVLTELAAYDQELDI